MCNFIDNIKIIITFVLETLLLAQGVVFRKHKNEKMKKNLFSAGILLLSASLSAQLTFVGNDATVTVQPNTLVYNGGGMKLDTRGVVNNSGNIMLVGVGTDSFVTGSVGTFNLKYINPTSYGQLYIDGIPQNNLTGIVTKEYKEIKHGAYQQIGLPFIGKTLNDLTIELSKTFSNTRYSQNEILIWDNTSVISRNTNLSSATADPTAYYMLGGLGLDINRIGNPFLLNGKPYANGINRTLSGAGLNINFGSGGNNVNFYREKYNTYVSDPFVTTAWSPTFGKDMYQYSNPYFTNIDLSDIGLADSNGDGNNITNLQGIVIQPSMSNVTFNITTGSRDISPNFITYTSGTAIPAGDVDRLLVKPLQSFTIKLSSAATATLSFDKLRRFKNNARSSGTAYSVTAGKASSSLKQLGVIALDANNNEMGRTYFVVYPNGVSGNSDIVGTQATGIEDDVIKTFEENKVSGGLDTNYSAKYSLYINEANEVDFKGKAIAMELYSSDIKSLKFEIRENAKLVDKDTHLLSGGTGFYIKGLNGNLQEITQDRVILSTTDQYSLYYGKPESFLATGDVSDKPSRTKITYNPLIDNYIIRFDPLWKKADIQVFDLSGRLVLSKNDVSTSSDFVLQLSKERRAYLVTAVSEMGEKASTKIIR